MGRFRHSFLFSLMIAVLGYVGIQSLGIIFHSRGHVAPFLSRDMSFLAIPSTNLGGVVVFAIVLGFLEFRRMVAGKRRAETVEFLAAFYNNRALDAFRKAFAVDADPADAPAVIDDDFRHAMNLLEVAAASTREGHFDLHIVYASLGGLVAALAAHPLNEKFRAGGYGYPTFFKYLVPKVLEMRDYDQDLPIPTAEEVQAYGSAQNSN